MPNRTASRIVSLAFELNGSGESVRLLPDGDFRAWDGRPDDVPAWRLGAHNAPQILAFAADRQSDRVADYEHASLRAKESGREAPAAGWWRKLEYRPGDGLYATDVRWTDRAKAMIAAGEYRYISPVFAYDAATGDVLAILSFALTNDPALDGLDDLALAAASALYLPEPTEPPMDKELLERLRYLLNLPTASTAADISAELGKIQGLIAQMIGTDGATVGLMALLEQSQARIATLTAAQTPDPAKYVPIGVVTDLQGKLAELTGRIDSGEKDRLVQSGLADGRILPGEHEAWARSLDVAALTAYLKTAPNIAALGATQTGGKPPAGNADPAQPVEERAKAEFEKSAALRAEFGSLDVYTAYCRAHESGLVRITGGKE